MHRPGNEQATAYLGLGSNLGGRELHVRQALLKLHTHPQIEFDWGQDVASLYETAPVGGPPEQSHYVNTALRVFTTLTPHDLLKVCLSIEKEMGRRRDERWGPRIIDIDVLLFGNTVISDNVLTLPHPYMHERLFVLRPLSEIASDVIHPIQGRTVTTLLRSCQATHPEQVAVPLSSQPQQR